MILVSSVIALFFVAFLTQPTPGESLKCYECAGNKSCGRKSTDRIVDCAGKCLSYLHEYDNETIIQRCCSDNCKIEDDFKAYSCSKDKCNGIHSDRKLLAMKNNLSPKRIVRKRTADNSSSSLSCYDCSAHNPNCAISEATVAQGCRVCLVFQNIFDNNSVNRRCCTSGCGEPGTIGDYEGRTAYFCGSDLCNGIGAENELNTDEESSTSMASSTSLPTGGSTTIATTTVQTSFRCYDCSGPDCGKEGSSVSTSCPSCIAYRNPDDRTKIERRCCWWACGAPNTVSMYNGIETYFCNGDKCNGDGVESALTPLVTTTGSSMLTTATTTQQTVSRCYECSGSDCGKPGSYISANCPSCMVYRNPDDQSRIERRCCWWACGPSNTVSMHNGVETYFCSGDECNEYGVESALTPLVTTTATGSSTVTATAATGSSMVTTAATTQQTSFRCYDCSGPDCGKEGSSVSTNCPSCIAYRNPDDRTKIERRCCWWACGAPNTVSMYNGIETYFCNGDKCNGDGVESALTPLVTTTVTQSSTVTATAATGSSTVTATGATGSSMVTTAATTQQTSSQCYDCSGPDCGKEGSSVSTNCPSCMAYRNSNDQTKIERRCCWWACGAPNTVSMYNGIETYFCTGDKCNGDGVESALTPLVTTITATGSTMTASITTATQMTTATGTITSSSGSCILNCQNGGTPETENGCFCYCLDNTNGRECENVDCAQPDIDSETCSSENQPLCEESENFAFECHHLCGKC